MAAPAVLLCAAAPPRRTQTNSRALFELFVLMYTLRTSVTKPELLLQTPVNHGSSMPDPLLVSARQVAAFFEFFARSRLTSVAELAQSSGRRVTAPEVLATSATSPRLL